MKKIIIEFDDDFHKELKIHCVMEEITVKAFVAECVRKELEAKKEQTQ